jgi:hypothetical protein
LQQQLSSQTQHYASSGLPPHEDHQGFYFPDAVITPFVDQARRLMPNLFGASRAPESAPSIPEPRFSLEEAKKLVIAALDKFDPGLGRKAKEIMDDPARWNLEEVPPGQSRMQRCLPAQSPATKYDPANPLPYAVIDYHFDGTIDGVIYLAHELGHAIADDYTREAGHSYRDTPQHLGELQAYFVQHIVYDHLARHRNPEIADAARRYFSAMMAQNIGHFPVALEALGAQRRQGSSVGSRQGD